MHQIFFKQAFISPFLLKQKSKQWRDCRGMWLIYRLTVTFFKVLWTTTNPLNSRVQWRQQERKWLRDPIVLLQQVIVIVARGLIRRKQETCSAPKEDYSYSGCWDNTLQHFLILTLPPCTLHSENSFSVRNILINMHIKTTKTHFITLLKLFLVFFKYYFTFE